MVTHTHLFNSPFSGATRVSRYQKGKTNLDFTEETVRGSGISWDICKPASRSRQITMPAPHHSVCPSCHQTNSVKAPKAHKHNSQQTPNRLRGLSNYVYDISPVSVNLLSAFKNISVPGLVPWHYHWSPVNYSPPPVDPEVILLLGPL